MDLGLALHAGGDLSCGVESFVEGVFLDGLEGLNKGSLVFVGGVSWEKKVGRVACGVWFHLPDVLCRVHNYRGSAFVCWLKDYIFHLSEFLEGAGFLSG